MIELQTSVKTSKHDDTTRTRTPKPGYLKLTNIIILNGLCQCGYCRDATIPEAFRREVSSLYYYLQKSLPLERVISQIL
jgi:hypothetical protein